MDKAGRGVPIIRISYQSRRRGKGTRSSASGIIRWDTVRKSVRWKTKDMEGKMMQVLHIQQALHLMTNDGDMLSILEDNFDSLSDS